MPFWNGLFWQIPVIQRKKVTGKSKARRTVGGCWTVKICIYPQLLSVRAFKKITIVHNARMRDFCSDQGRNWKPPATE